MDDINTFFAEYIAKLIADDGMPTSERPGKLRVSVKVV